MNGKIKKKKWVHSRRKMKETGECWNKNRKHVNAYKKKAKRKEIGECWKKKERSWCMVEE